MLKFFGGRGRGSVTVFVTLIMIPTVFFTAFLGDLARTKLYSNIALMAADNYGENVLAEYDDLLRELYGFFSVTQDKKGLEAVKLLQDYSKTPFNPNASTISYQYLQAVMGTNSYDGFAPYASADVTLDYKPVNGAALNDREVFGTQLGDFMRFRIVQQLLMSGDVDEKGEVGGELLNMQKEVQEHEGDMKAVKKHQEFAKTLEDYLALLGDYYDCLYLLEKEYRISYLNDYRAYQEGAVKQYNEFLEKDEYKEYYDYLNPDNQQAIQDALENRKKDPDNLSEEDKKWCEISDNYEDNKKYVDDFIQCKGDYKDSFKQGFLDLAMSKEYKIDDNKWEKQGKDAGDAHHINIVSYGDVIDTLNTLAGQIRAKAGDVVQAKKDLQAVLDSEDEKVSQDVKNSMEKDLSRVEELTNDNVLNIFTGIYEHLKDNKTIENPNFKRLYEYDSEAFGKIDDLITTGKIEPKRDITKHPDYDYYTVLKEEIKDLDFKTIDTRAEYKDLYNKLEQGFDTSPDFDVEQIKKDSEDRQDDANGKTENKEEENKADQKDEEDSKKVRNIPKSYDFGGVTGGSSSSLKDMMENVGSLITNGDWGGAGNLVLLKLYAIEYDFGMFSSRVTQVKKDQENNDKNAGQKILDNATGTSTISLTGYEKCKSINYMYGGELEYIINGSKNAKDNLNYTRNLICGFRMIMNLCSSFSIGQVNDAINYLCEAVSTIPFVGWALAIALQIALRFGFAALETYAEWQKLLEGKKVLLYKRELKQLDCLDTIYSWLGIKGDKPQKEEGFGFTYEQYLMIMMLFLTSSDKVFDRTENLIELNMNGVIEEVGEKGTLKDDYSKAAFKMQNAYTAVEATCTVHMDFVLIPDGFAKAFLGAKTGGAEGSSYEELKDLEKTVYEFKVVRGY